MSITRTQHRFILISLLILLAGVLYTRYLRPNALILDTIVPTAGQQTRIFFTLETDTLLIPSQCVYTAWDMDNTRGVYINGAGVGAPDARHFCHLPVPNGIFQQLRVILPDDTSISYDFKVRILAYDPVFLAISLAMMCILFTLMAGRGLWFSLGMVGIIASIALMAIFLVTALRFIDTSPTVWDDALMFARYAHNLHQTGIWSWNAGESPVFGMTEVLYGAVVYHTTVQNPHLNPIQSVQFTSATMGFVWLASLLLIGSGYAFFRKHTSHMIAIITLFLVLIGLSAHTNLLHHFTSGMGTTTALVYVTLYSLLTSTYRHATHTPMHIIMGIFGGLGFVIRPDVMLFTICVPLAVWLFAKTPKARRNALIFGMTTLVTLAILLLIARLYFGVALPLPFFAKSGGIYDGYLANQYVSVAIDQLGAYLHSNRYLILLIIGGVIASPMRFVGRINAVQMGLGVGMLGYIGYYALFVTQIMPEYQRFYYPTLPIVLWFGFIGASVIAERLHAYLIGTESAPMVRVVVIGALISGMVFGIANSLYEAYRFSYQHETTYYPPHDARWYKLADFAPVDNLTVATTEVGAVAVANFSWRVIDMAGLNDTTFALSGFSADILLDEYRPDLLYLPYPDYIAMTQAITTHPHFTRDYTYITAGQIRLPMGIAIRNDSPAYQHLMAIIQP